METGPSACLAAPEKAWKSGQPFSSQAHASPSRTKLLSFHALRAAVIPENSTDQSRPLRDQRCTLSPSFRATMRKPSCLTAKSQPGPIGGFSARTGWAGRINPGGRGASVWSSA